MAENLLIGPQVIPIRGREASGAAESPQLAQVQKATGHLEEMMGHLLRSTATQEEANTDNEAYLWTKSQLDSLDKNTDNIRDFDTKIKIYNTGIDSIKSNFTKIFPTLKSGSAKALAIEVDGAARDHYAKAVADRRMAGGRDYKAVLAGLKNAVSKSTSDADRSRAETRATNLINSALNNGYISKEEANLEKSRFHYNAHFDKLKQIIGSDPTKISTIPFPKSGLNYDDWRALSRDAHAAVQEKLNIYKDQHAKDVNDAIQKATANPNLLRTDGRIRALVPKSWADELIPPISEPEVDDIIHNHIEGKWETATDLDHYYNDSVQKQKMFPDSAARVRQAYTRERELMTSDFGKYIRDHQKQLKLEIDTLHKIPRFTPPGMKDPHTQFMKRMGDMISDMPNRVKTTEDVDKAYDTMKGLIDKEFAKPPATGMPAAKTTPGATGTPAATATPGAAATPGTPKAEATPKPVPPSEYPGGGPPGSAGAHFSPTVLPWKPGSFIDRLSQAESGTWGVPGSARNVLESLGTDSTTPEDERSQGYFGIKSPTGRLYAKAAGLPGFSRAMKLDPGQQEALVKMMPFGLFGPRTQQLLQSVYGPIDPRMTIGSLAAKFDS